MLIFLNSVKISILPGLRKALSSFSNSQIYENCFVMKNSIIENSLIKKYSSKKDEMKTNFENRCIEECNEACGKKRTSSVTSLIHLYKRDGKPRNKQRRKFALYGLTQ